MESQSRQLIQKLWNYCNLLRDDGLSYGDYLEQLTYLLFLKMSYEQTEPPLNRPSSVPAKYNWKSLLSKEGEALEQHYTETLSALGQNKGLLGLIFLKAQNKIHDPAKLRRLIVDLINREHWTGLSGDVKGDAYEGLLEKNAQDTKSGAGQYFTPRALIETIVDTIRPQPGEVICDPACGTGGFLLAAHEYIEENNPHLDRAQKKHLRYKALRGYELVAGVTRLCAMNLMLHGIGPTNGGNEELPVKTTDSLETLKNVAFDVVLTNPPFGKKSSVTIVAEDEEAEENGNGHGKKNGKNGKQALTLTREDFWATTSNKQLNFVQLIKNILKINGRAAVIVPDNVLFEGGAGETVRRKLLEECDVHTLLRLPTGLFYAQGVKANVLFFDRKPPAKQPWTKELWIYDFRTNVRYTLKTNQLKRSDIDEFVACYKPENRHQRKSTWSEDNPQGRWRAYSYEELLQRDKLSLDIFWLKDEDLEGEGDAAGIDEIMSEIIYDLRAALAQFEEINNDMATR